MEQHATSADEATILLVDDNPINLGLLTRLLAGRGWRVLVAQQGESGLRIAERARPDLVMLDVELPGMNGFAVCRRLKSTPGMAEIPVLFMTVRTEAADKLEGFQAGGVDYIVKPFEEAEVLARVTAHLRIGQLTRQLQAQNVQLQREICQRQRTEEALTAERNLLRTLIDISPDQIYVKDCESRFMLLNPAVVHDLGATSVGEVIGRTDLDFHPPHLAVQYRADEQAIIATGQPLINKDETRVDPATGAVTWVLATKVPVRDARGQIVGLVGINRDITERKQAEEALRQAQVDLERRVESRTADLVQANLALQSEIAERRRVEEELVAERNLLRTVIDNAPEQIYIKDTQSRFVLANTATLDQLKLSGPDQLIGKTDFDFFPPAQAAAYLADERAVLETGIPMVNKEESGPDEQTGELLWGLTTKVPVRDTLGQVVGLVGMSRDITEHKRVEERLRANEAQLRAYTQRLEILRAIDQAILAAQSPEAIVQAALSRIRGLVPCDWASVAMLDAAARTTTVLAIHTNNHVETLAGTVGAVETLEMVDALRRGEIQVVDDSGSSGPHMPAAVHLPPGQMRSWVNVPLVAAGDLLGILTLAADRPHVFASEQVAIACEVAGQISVALQNARLFAEVSAARAHLQTVSRQMVAVQEAERARIARDLHDEIGQMLTGLKLVMAIGTRSTPAVVQERLAEAQALINDLTTRVREISLDLRPSMLDDLGLRPTLLWHVKRYTQQTRIQVTMKHTGLDQRVAAEVEIAVYRIVQEALTNVARHADVDQVAVWLWRTSDSIGVRIEDHGRGFTPEVALAAHSSNGLTGMVERVRLLGGQLTIESAPGQGTRLTAELPLGAGAEP